MTDLFRRLAAIDHLHESGRCAHLGLAPPPPLSESLEQPDTNDERDADLWHESAQLAGQRWFQSLPMGQRERGERAGISEDPDGGVSIDAETMEGDPRPEERQKALAAMKAAIDSLGMSEFLVVTGTPYRDPGWGPLVVKISRPMRERMKRYHPAVIFGDFAAYEAVMVAMWKVAMAGALAMKPVVKIPRREQLLAPRPRRLDQSQDQPSNLDERRIQPGGRELEPVSSEMLARRLWMEMQADRDAIPGPLWTWLAQSVTLMAHGGGDEKMQRQMGELLAADTGRLIPPRTRAVLTMIADPTMMVTRG